ncbi:hypothetical protein BKA83DRAFT_1895999 [Pisolithus microcarpus]|nr:hypothetical protein BKA83DRAFT_1895999 [Pisolithus microcarpus]
MRKRSFIIQGLVFHSGMTSTFSWNYFTLDELHVDCVALLCADDHGSIANLVTVHRPHFLAIPTLHHVDYNSSPLTRFRIGRTTVAERHAIVHLHRTILQLHVFP